MFFFIDGLNRLSFRHSGFCEEEGIHAYYNDLRLLLNHLGCYPYDRQSSMEKYVFVKSVYLEAEEDGLWYCKVKPNDRVKRGQLLGHTEDFYSTVLHRYYAEANGIVFYHCCGLSVTVSRRDRRLSLTPAFLIFG